MENAFALVLVITLASLFGLWHKLNQGSIKSAKNHPNFSSDFSKYGQLGSSGTLVQFSTQFCSICPASKEVLKQISNQYKNLEFIEIDAEANLELTKKLAILTTPTVLILDERGEEVARFSGKPNKIKILKFINEYLFSNELEKRLV